MWHCAQSLFLKATLVKIVAIYQVLEMKIKMLTFEPSGDSLILIESKSNTGIKNKEYNVCNWLVKKIPRRILSSLSTKSNDTEPF
jgi:hypothetical protein